MGNCQGIMRPPPRLASRRSSPSSSPEEPGPYDTALRRRASRATTAAVVSGVEVRSLSLASLRDVTGCLLDMNQEVVRVVLACNKRRDAWWRRCPDHPFDLVQDHFDASLRTLDLLAALNSSLHRGRDAGEVYASTPGDLRELMAAAAAAAAADHPFTGEFFAAFRSVYRRQTAMADKLRWRKRRLDGRIQSVRPWRRVSGVVFVTAFATLLVCSVVAAAIAAPPVAAALAAAVSMPVGPAGRWIDSLLKRYHDALQGHKEVVIAMQVGTFVAIKDLDSIRTMVEHLEVQMSSMVDSVEFAECGEEAVRFGIEEIKKKLEAFMRSVDDLREQADRCSRDIRRARTVVLQRMIHHPYCEP